MPIDRAAIADTLPTSRSRVTNHADLLPGIDGRSPTARRYRDLVLSIISDLGGNDLISEAERQLARRGAAMAVLSEQLEAQIVNGDPVSVEDLVKLANGQNRTFASIGLRRRSRDVTPTLEMIRRGEVA